MDLRFSEEDEKFRREVAAWLEENLSGEFAVVRGRGGTGDEGSLIEERKAWERRLGEAGWIGLGWPEEVGGRGLPLMRKVIFYEEYARAGGPGRIGHMGETLLGPTLLARGTQLSLRLAPSAEASKRRSKACINGSRCSPRQLRSRSRPVRWMPAFLLASPFRIESKPAPLSAVLPHGSA